MREPVTMTSAAELDFAAGFAAVGWPVAGGAGWAAVWAEAATAALKANSIVLANSERFIHNIKPLQ
jgi:hypothetical protein